MDGLLYDRIGAATECLACTILSSSSSVRRGYCDQPPRLQRRRRECSPGREQSRGPCGCLGCRERAGGIVGRWMGDGRKQEAGETGSDGLMIRVIQRRIKHSRSLRRRPAHARPAAPRTASGRRPHPAVSPGWEALRPVLGAVRTVAMSSSPCSSLRLPLASAGVRCHCHSLSHCRCRCSPNRKRQTAQAGRPSRAETGATCSSANPSLHGGPDTSAAEISSRLRGG